MSSRDGTISIEAGHAVLRYERRYEHPIERVWDAITRPERLVDWLGDAEVELEQGGAIRVTWLNTDEQGNSAVFTGRITRFEPPHVFEYDGDIHGRLRWELSEDGPAATVLRLTNWTPAPPEFRSKTAAGWDIHLDHLAAALDGGSVDWPRWYDEHYPAWQSKEARYAEAASQLGG
ncbi:MAG: hypothetical protein QOC55_1883 [Thermoleophilaceae bacterium]|jgi:uncharacterized protein YndB with AHSA1/START domain|nr:hypothetical protein [Thermoleophilaceae bacterium]